MNKTLWHRGPSDDGLWVDPAVGIVLASRRLAIRDLSPSGRMPMTSRCGRYVIAYNGEVYNFQDVRRELEEEGQRFVSHSDTEVLIEAIALWGVKRALTRMNGMFSFALWDKIDRTLVLIRDRLGVKPLYYGWCQNTFLFGSELKALYAFANFRGTLDRKSLRLFLRLGYIPGPHTIYKGFYKLQPGHSLAVSTTQEHASPKPYWDVRTMVQLGVGNRFAGDIQEATDEAERLLLDSVRMRMVADVPVGAFLSGGIDSSLVVAMMQAQATSPVKTFTIGFAEDSHNEGHYAKAIAQYLGTDHTELYLSPKEAYDIIPLLPTIYDEPFADPSQIPTFLVSQLARQSVTVSLSGDGGDELFGGYKEYLLGNQRLKLLRRIPRIAWSVMQGVNKSLEILTGRRIREIEILREVRTPEAMRHYHASQCMWPEELVLGEGEHPTAFTEPSALADVLGDIERMMYVDVQTYLQEDILTKLDRASMAVSLEAREPLLDYRFVEFSWRLPLEFKIQNGQGKQLLRMLLARYLPTHMFERPKMGFGLPLGQWLRGPLRPWVEELLAPTMLQQQEIFNPKAVAQIWADHLQGRRNRGTELWGILMFQAWQQRWM
jgi:asparagine synthase (glutamine-hydrolysing)